MPAQFIKSKPGIIYPKYTSVIILMFLIDLLRMCIDDMAVNWCNARDIDIFKAVAAQGRKYKFT